MNLSSGLDYTYILILYKMWLVQNRSINLLLVFVESDNAGEKKISLVYH
jgi:hypothetical protein